MADAGGARPESERGRGFRWPEVGGLSTGSGGERRWCSRGGTGEEWVMEERTAFRARFENGQSVARQRGRGGVQPRECHAAWGGVVGPGPDRRAKPGSGPSAARAGALPAGNRGGLTGGPRHSARRRCH
jgi:hypothetical protein